MLLKMRIKKDGYRLMVLGEKYILMIKVKRYIIYRKYHSLELSLNDSSIRTGETNHTKQLNQDLILVLCMIIKKNPYLRWWSILINDEKVSSSGLEQQLENLLWSMVL